MLIGIYNFIASAMQLFIGGQDSPTDGIPKVRSVWNE